MASNVRRLVLSAVALALVGCSGAPVVGVLRPVSGSAQAYGDAVGTGIQVALEEAWGGAALPAGFAVIDVDTGSNPELAASELRRLVNEERVRLVVGGMTPAEATALLPVIEEEQVVCLSPTTSTIDLGRHSRFFYRLFATDEAEGRTTARHLHDKLGLRSVLVFTDDSGLTRGVEEEFRQHFQMALSGKIVGTVHLDSKLWQKNSVDTLHAKHPDAVYIVGHAESILRALQHLEEVGFDGVRATTSTVYLADVLQRAGTAGEGAVFPLSAYDAASVHQPVQGFVERYRGRYGYEPDIFAAHGYDAMRLAMHTLSTTPAVFSAEMRKVMSFELGDFRGVTGAIAFDESGRVPRYPVMHCVHQGRVISYRQYKELRLQAVQDAMGALSKASNLQRRGRVGNLV